jgi:hypothetical protein
MAEVARTLDIVYYEWQLEVSPSITVFTYSIIG